MKGYEPHKPDMGLITSDNRNHTPVVPRRARIYPSSASEAGPSPLQWFRGGLVCKAHRLWYHAMTSRLESNKEEEEETAEEAEGEMLPTGYGHPGKHIFLSFNGNGNYYTNRSY